MKKLLLIACILLISGGFAFGETLFEKIDRMHEEELHRENFTLIEDSIASTSNAIEKSELYWRLARTTLEIGDLLEQEGAGEGVMLDTFIEAEEYADEAISLNPNSYQGYYWKSANMGRWGETKGILNSLFKAKPMRNVLRQALEIYPEHPDSYYVLGIMYRKVPGRPISFGSSNRAVSLGRKAIDAHLVEFEAGEVNDIKLSYYMELARSIESRNWSASKRRKEKAGKAKDYRSETDTLEKNFEYEGVVDIPDMSDKDEAIEIMRWVISEFGKKSSLKNSEQVDLDEAREDLETWSN
ncbi:MAG: hypothetical protein HN368_03410 [Spirochaetales bacterium]|jgi:tetratricopeptide (TPR) repeat protein|nr:hypothetical protein [Spirochaetales bacterium]